MIDKVIKLLFFGLMMCLFIVLFAILGSETALACGYESPDVTIISCKSCV